MENKNVQSLSGITLVGGGDPNPKDIAEIVALAPFLVAADGGANFAVAAGFEPRAVIGDFDSLGAEVRAALPEARFIEVAEQTSTDFEKALARIEAPFVLATGFAGDRLDHTLAAFSVLVQKIGPPTIIVGASDVVFAAPAHLTMDLAAGVRVSLIPMARIQGRSTGLHWQIDGLDLNPMGRVGTSNLSNGPVTLEFDQPGCLVIMPREALSHALAGLIG